MTKLFNNKSYAKYSESIRSTLTMFNNFPITPGAVNMIKVFERFRFFPYNALDKEKPRIIPA
jgi:hypothetical protein